MTDLFTITDAAHKLGVSAKTLRRWEKKGIIIPVRTAGNQRRYASEQLDAFINKTPVDHVEYSRPSCSFHVSRIHAFIGITTLLVGLVFGISRMREKTDASVLGITDTPVTDYTFTVNIPASFTKEAAFSNGMTVDGGLIVATGKLTASNILYSLTAGDGIEVGTGQTPTIKNTGVLSLQSKTGALSLEAGSGITLDGLKITNSDRGTSTQVFKTINTAVADSNTDTLTLAGAGGVTITTSDDSDTITITAATPDYTLSGFTDGGTSVYLSTITDNVGLGTITPSYKLHTVGTGYFSDTLTADGALSVSGTTTLSGALLANGAITLGNATTDTITFTGRLANGTSILPNTDIGTDLGSSGLRFTNLYVANIHANESQDFSGQTTFYYAPTDTTISEASVIINPTTSVANGQFLAFGIAGYQRALIDKEGDLILGYSNLTSAPATDYPLTIYGHSGTNVAYLDTSGNLNIIGGYNLLSSTTLGASVVNSSLTSTGALNSGSITSGFGSIDTGSDTITTTGTVGSAGTTTFTGDSLTLDNTLSTPQITSTGILSILPGTNVGIGTATPAQKLTVLGDLASSVATGVEGLKLTDTTDVTKLAMKWTGTGVNFDTPSLSTVNKLSNGTFETNLTGWDTPYTLNDQFTTNRAAGAVNGTSAEPTGGTRTVVDTGNALSISSSTLTSSGGGAIWYPAISRAAGLTFVADLNVTNNLSSVYLGFDNNTTGTPGADNAYIANFSSVNTIADVLVGDGVPSFGTWVNNTAYKIAKVLKSTGSYYFIKGGTFTNWTLLYITPTGSTATLYPTINSSSAATYDNIRIPTATWLPTPLAYDDFASADMTSKATGPDDQTTPSLAWTGGSDAGGVMTITPTLGSELLTDPGLEGNYTAGLNDNLTKGGSPTLAQSADIHGGSKAQEFTGTIANDYVNWASITPTTGTWYLASVWGKRSVGTSTNNTTRFIQTGGTSVYGSAWSSSSYVQSNIVIRATSTNAMSLRPTNELGSSNFPTVIVDDGSITALTLSSLFSTVSTSDSDVIADANVTLTAGTQAGLVLNLDSTSSPANFIIVYHNGTQVLVDEVVAGVYTNKQTTTVTYSAGATLRAIREGTKLRVYYNNALVGSELTMTANTNTKHGLFSTYSGNSFDNFTLWARGTGNEYVNLPDVELTATRDTGVHYSGSSSMKLVASTNDNTYAQSVTLPDTSAYNLTAYVYTDGSAVTTTDLDLYYDTGDLTTTFTSVGSGWYRLSGSLTGVASAKQYGVKVHAGKTVYVDNISLFTTSGAGTVLAVSNSTTGLGGLSVESTTTLNSGLSSLQALIVKGSTEWQNSAGTVLASMSSAGILSTTQINALDGNGLKLYDDGGLGIVIEDGGNVGIGIADSASKLHVLGTTEQLRLGYDTSNYWSNTVGATGGLTMQGVGTGGSLTLSPTAGQNLNISLSTTGDFAVNSTQLYVDTSSGNVGVGTATPTSKLHVTGAVTGKALSIFDETGDQDIMTASASGVSKMVLSHAGYLGLNTTAPTALLDLAGTSGTDAFRLTNAGSKVLGLSYATNATTFDQTSTDPTNKLTNGTFDTDITTGGWAQYSLEDQFTTDRATGAVNGTSAEPTGGTRTVVDTESKLSIASGALSFAGGKASPAYGNPGLWYPAVTRTAGLVSITKINEGTLGSGLFVGFDSNQYGSYYIGIAMDSSYLYTMGSVTANLVGSALSTSTDYLLATVLRATGEYYYIKGGTQYPNWTLLYISSTGNVGTLYPSINNYNAIATADNIRIPTSTWLPTPLAYDDFASADMTSKATGPDDQTTPSLAWTGGSDAGGVMTITPTLGSEALTNGNFSAWTANDPDSWTVTESLPNNEVSQVGTGEGHGGSGTGMANLYSASGVPRIQQNVTTSGVWYQASVLIDTRISGDIYMGNNATYFGSWNTTGTKTVTYRAVNTNLKLELASADITVDDVSLKPLTLSSLFSSVSTSDADVIADVTITATAGTQAGIVTNLDSTSSPANFIIVYHDGTKLYVDEAVAGVYTNKQNTTVALGAGALRVIRDGTKLRVYLNNALVGAELTMTANTNTKHGLFSTYSGNSFDNFTLWARGTGNEYVGIPDVALTATRDTTTKYNNSTASLKLVASTNDHAYTQSVNVGDTSTYNLIAYAYTTGAAVTSADLSLYYDTGDLTTTYTPMGASGWYKLTGTLTGVASAKNYGVRVKAGKTVYVDEMHLQVGVGTAQTMYVMNSNTGVTGLNVQGLINGTLNGIATYSKAGTISDSDFGGGVENGMIAIDSTNGRIYFRYGGSWHYASQTAGFQIPKEEVSGLSKGDYLAPYVDTFMSDGAIHGLYKKLDINDILESTSSVTFKNPVTLNAPTLFSKLAEFFGTTIFHTPPTFPNNMGGIAVIPPSSTTVDVSFPTPFETPPVVRMSLVLDSSTSSAFLSDKLRAAIFGVTEHGFSIVLNTPVPANTTYHWMALSVQGDTP